MEGESSTKTSNKSVRKLDVRRRSWTYREEEALINALKEVINQGWKCENGFRTGYLSVLEKYMMKVFPGSDLRGDPYINSKIHVWKKNYGSLCTMLSRSGFGWNDAAHMITVESDDVWEQHVKTDSNARTMRFKSFPFYHAWCEIFGKDRATGEHAEDCNAAANDQYETRNVVELEDTGNWTDLPCHGFVEENNDFMSVCQPGSSSSAKSSKSKKRKADDDRIVGLMGAFCEQSNARLDNIAKRIGYEFDVSEKRTAVYEALGKLRDLTMPQKIYVAKLLVNKKEDLDLFFSLPDDAKAEMVRMIISGQI